jgi:hypothetical protein
MLTERTKRYLTFHLYAMCGALATAEHKHAAAILQRISSAGAAYFVSTLIQSSFTSPTPHDAELRLRIADDVRKNRAETEQFVEGLFADAHEAIA